MDETHAFMILIVVGFTTPIANLISLVAWFYTLNQRKQIILQRATFLLIVATSLSIAAKHYFSPAFEGRFYLNLVFSQIGYSPISGLLFVAVILNQFRPRSKEKKKIGESSFYQRFNVGIFVAIVILFFFWVIEAWSLSWVWMIAICANFFLGLSWLMTLVVMSVFSPHSMQHPAIRRLVIGFIIASGIAGVWLGHFIYSNPMDL